MRICLPMQGIQVRSLVRATRKHATQRSAIVASSARFGIACLPCAAVAAAERGWKVAVGVDLLRVF